MARCEVTRAEMGSTLRCGLDTGHSEKCSFVPLGWNVYAHSPNEFVNEAERAKRAANKLADDMHHVRRLLKKISRLVDSPEPMAVKALKDNVACAIGVCDAAIARQA